MINIAIGLPASGKTTYFQAQLGTYIDGDLFSSLDDVIAAVKLAPQPVWLDGLYLTAAVQRQLSRAFSNTVRFFYWTPNTDACLYNDTLRDRPLSSAITIRNSLINKPSDATIIQTIKYDQAYYLLVAIYPKCPLYFRSSSWSLGGTSGNCWDDELTHIPTSSPEPLSDVFSYSPEILTLISRLNYSTEQLLTHSEIFVENSEGEGDYYGGYETRAWWEITASDVIRVALIDVYNLDPSNLIDFRDQLPELFL
jgi:hypothetical protein